MAPGKGPRTEDEKTDGSGFAPPVQPGPHNDPALAERGRKQERDEAKEERERLLERLKMSEDAHRNERSALIEKLEEAQVRAETHASLLTLARNALVDIVEAFTLTPKDYGLSPIDLLGRVSERAQGALDDMAKRGVGLDDEG